ncbi:hypothetical protein [Streptomyces sp. NRRL WC-3742]|uniref:hypothetical protein n=1 Tax=Streptomyces sp. NRRL WC-3742 TaxID=1463934 RepID=UPI0004C6DD86|nr:hypothetical protein [Streptomyces sp. NRRL WC-3742]
MARGGSGDGDGGSGREGLGAKLAGIGTLIAALGTVLGVVLTQGSGSSDTPKADPPAATSTPTAPTAPASAPAATSPAPLRSSPTVSPSADGNSGAVANGTQLGNYAVHLSGGYGVPLPNTAPKLSDYEQGEPGDVYVGSEAQAFGPSGQNKLIPLPAGTLPTYGACTAKAAFAAQAPSSPGTAFCIKTPGRMIGLQVTGSHYAAQPFWAEAQVTVWQDVG